MLRHGERRSRPTLLRTGSQPSIRRSVNEEDVERKQAASRTLERRRPRPFSRDSCSQLGRSVAVCRIPAVHSELCARDDVSYSIWGLELAEQSSVFCLEEFESVVADDVCVVRRERAASSARLLFAASPLRVFEPIRDGQKCLL